MESLGGAFVIGVLADGMVLLGVSEFWQIIIKGLVIVFAVTIDQVQVRLHNWVQTRSQTAQMAVSH
jgi:erythritol transport system permease protein